MLWLKAKAGHPSFLKQTEAASSENVGGRMYHAVAFELILKRRGDHPAHISRSLGPAHGMDLLKVLQRLFTGVLPIICG